MIVITCCVNGGDWALNVLVVFFSADTTMQIFKNVGQNLELSHPEIHKFDFLKFKYDGGVATS